MNTADCIKFLTSYPTDDGETQKILAECAARLAYFYFQSSRDTLPSIQLEDLPRIVGNVVYIPIANCLALVDVRSDGVPLFRFYDGSTSLASDWLDQGFQVLWFNRGTPLPQSMDIDDMLNKLSTLSIENASMRSALRASSSCWTCSNNAKCHPEGSVKPPDVCCGKYQFGSSIQNKGS